MQSLDEVNKYLNSLSDEERQRVIEDSLRLTQNRLWIPNPGPQTAAYYSEADELLYGGQAGGGKTDLIAGLSLTEHKRSLVLRRTNKEAIKLVERYQEILKTRDGWNGQEGIWRLPDGRIIDIGGCQNEEDKQKYKGTPHDLKAFDELVDFSESQYLFITIWNRSADPNQRCRVVATTNPPTQAEGLWVIRRWGPWLDPRHPRPAKPGELRWFLRRDLPDGTVEEKEVDGPGPYKVEDGLGGFEWVKARSRTFIRSTLQDNPDLARTDYGSMLNSLPKEYRDAYKTGKFDLSLKDHPFQAIPTSWILQAIERRRKTPRPDVPMSALAADIAQGGDDQTVIATRYWGWFNDLEAIPGRQTPDGSSAAAAVVKFRRGNCPVIIDMGGGYGGACYEHLKENDTKVFGHKGSVTDTTAKTRDGLLGFYNKRSEVIWRFREALDPDQEGGSPICLPDDPEMIADLSAPTFKVVNGKIKVESKEDVMNRLKRSTDKGDSVVMCWSRGDKPGSANSLIGGKRGRTPQVQVGYPQVRRYSQPNNRR